MSGEPVVVSENADVEVPVVEVPEVELDEFGNPVVDEEVPEVKEGETETSKIDAETPPEKEQTDTEQERNFEQEVQSLRQLLRAQKKAIAELQADLKQQRKALVDKDIVADGEIGLTEDEQRVAALRESQLDTMVELMELSPQFADVRSVCTQANLDDVVENLAKAYAADKGGDVDAIAAAIHEEIWAKPNPYKEMYTAIKRFHPAYAKKETPAKSEPVEPKPKPPAAPSLSELPSGKAGKHVGWTSDRIDALSEMELSKVPPDVYEMYMRGDLP